MAEEKELYKQIHEFVKRLENDWFFFTYDDMINKNFKGLNYYLGFNVAGDVEVPKKMGKSKVIRKKSTGDSRHWFTEADIDLLKPVYIDYMMLIG